MHFLGPYVISEVVLSPGVILYPFLSSLSSLSSAACCWVCACLWWGYAWDVSSLCGAYVRVFASQSALRVLVSFSAPVVFLSFCGSVWSFLFPLLRWFCLFVLFPLLSFRRRASLPLGIPWALGEPQVDVSNSEECSLEFGSVIVIHDI